MTFHNSKILGALQNPESSHSSLAVTLQGAFWLIFKPFIKTVTISFLFLVAIHYLAKKGMFFSLTVFLSFLKVFCCFVNGTLPSPSYIFFKKIFEITRTSFGDCLIWNTILTFCSRKMPWVKKVIVWGYHVFTGLHKKDDTIKTTWNS